MRPTSWEHYRPRYYYRYRREYHLDVPPTPANPSSLDYPRNHLLPFYDAIPDEEVWKPGQQPMHYSYATRIRVGPLNTIRSFTKVYIQGQPGEVSRKVVVLPRNTPSPGISGRAAACSRAVLAQLRLHLCYLTGNLYQRLHGVYTNYKVSIRMVRSREVVIVNCSSRNYSWKQTGNDDGPDVLQYRNNYHANSAWRKSCVELERCGTAGGSGGKALGTEGKWSHYTLLSVYLRLRSAGGDGYRCGFRLKGSSD
jgi:hypothetical protein